MLDFLSDQIWFWLFEGGLNLVFLTALLKIYVFTEDSVVSGVQRGEISRGKMYNAFYILVTAFTSVIFTITTVPHDGKVFLYTLNVLQIFYLCMWNGWSTNKLIGLISKFENKNFNPHR